MEEKPKQSRSRARKFFTWLILWLAVSFAFFLTTLIVGIARDHPPMNADDYLTMILASLAGGGLAWSLWVVVRWLCCWRNLKRLAIGCGSILLLLILARVEENWRGKRAWDNFRREWEAKGERFDFKAFVPPPVPADQNFALTPVVASCYGNILDTNGNPICPHTTNVVDRLELRIDSESGAKDPTNGSWQKGTLTDLKGWQEYYRNLLVTNDSGMVTHEFPVPPTPQSAGTDVLLALSKYDEALKDLAVASQLPESRFPLNYDCENPAAILLPHLAAMKKCALASRITGPWPELEAGQSAQAGGDVTSLSFNW